MPPSIRCPDTGRHKTSIRSALSDINPSIKLQMGHKRSPPGRNIGEKQHRPVGQSSFGEASHAAALSFYQQKSQLCHTRTHKGTRQILFPLGEILIEYYTLVVRYMGKPGNNGESCCETSVRQLKQSSSWNSCCNCMYRMQAVNQQAWDMSFSSIFGPIRLHRMHYGHISGWNFHATWSALLCWKSENRSEKLFSDLICSACIGDCGCCFSYLLFK